MPLSLKSLIRSRTVSLSRCVSAASWRYPLVQLLLWPLSGEPYIALYKTWPARVRASWITRIGLTLLLGPDQPPTCGPTVGGVPTVGSEPPVGLLKGAVGPGPAVGAGPTVGSLKLNASTAPPAGVRPTVGT